ncbi:MAG: CRISPR-associated protein Cmr2 [Leptolyngbya sp. Prado105]|jgi:CRISPR-associated protein Cmr2|nr:CRISPR-associated protein Cmr2 [Leptolyngbya sp. Prado105]
MLIYTAFSFAPVQGFIEKSRKLRDLFGSSLILSYLSQKLANAAHHPPERIVISPASIDMQEGMPNRILVKGLFSRDEVKQVLIQTWDHILQTCRIWIETHLPALDRYEWETEWLHWKQYTWEIFWGTGETSAAAMQDLERRKLKRDWVGINWVGESSSLTGTDAIAGYNLGKKNSDPGRSLTPQETEELELFYRRLSWLLDAPDSRLRQPALSLAELREYENQKPNEIGKYIAPNERLSIPELVKRLVTYEGIAIKFGMDKLKQKPEDPEFRDIRRDSGDWTGWFMGDGDEVGKHLKTLTCDEDQTRFSTAMRNWGKTFKHNFPRQSGRVIYAGGDDFLGVLYAEQGDPISTETALNWLKAFPEEWKKHKEPINVSVGFVWAANRVPQRDVLQHCREAEKRSKTLGRDRVTIRVVFNSGQFGQWSCPWGWLALLDLVQDWNHLYSDWAYLKARHAVRLKEFSQHEGVNHDLAISVLKYYLDREGKGLKNKDGELLDQCWKKVAGEDSPSAIVQWIDDFIQVGWQLCSNI